MSCRLQSDRRARGLGRLNTGLTCSGSSHGARSPQDRLHEAGTQPRARSNILAESYSAATGGAGGFAGRTPHGCTPTELSDFALMALVGQVSYSALNLWATHPGL